jgi:tetratricopeptide (TPR) repeat protein
MHSTLGEREDNFAKTPPKIASDQETAFTNKPFAKKPDERESLMRRPRRSRLAGYPVDGLLSLVLDLPKRMDPLKSAPSLARPSRLEALFQELGKRRPALAPEDIENHIWSLWSDHPKPEALAAMNRAIDTIMMGEYALARATLDAIIIAHPDWPEAWNKRATLSFMEKRDKESLADIEETLRREPRHFGAIAGFGQICLRHGLTSEARAAFLVALSINPHLNELRDMAHALRPAHGTLH